MWQCNSLNHLVKEIKSSYNIVDRQGLSLERQLAEKFSAEEDHPGYPEKEDVMSSLQQGAGVEQLHVSGLQKKLYKIQQWLVAHKNWLMDWSKLAKKYQDCYLNSKYLRE